MSEQKINPELMLKAAEMADPTEKWVIVGNCTAFDISTTSENYDQWRYFNPLTSDADAWALERALKHEGWNFDFIHWAVQGEFEGGASRTAQVGPHYRARPHISSWGVQTDPSDTTLLLKCVSAMTGIPLYRSSSSDQPNPKTAGGGG